MQKIPLIVVGVILIIAIGLFFYTRMNETAPQNASNTVLKNSMAILKTNRGDIEIELFLDKTPITAGNFLKLAEEGFYDGVKFHRVIPNFMIQGGDPLSRGEDMARYGTGGPGYSISDEFVKGLSNVRGTISMANSGPNTGGSQFFINVADNIFLDFDKEPLTSAHAVFGTVTAGMEIVDAISNVKTGARDIPLTPVVIGKIEIQK